jgi:RNA polymerase sigma-70 factor (ECF subfamily)
VNHLNDMAVLVGIQARDRHALEAMYLGYHSHLTQFLSRVISAPNIIDDIIDETFFSVWKCAKDFDSESSIATWVFRIAYETALRSMCRCAAAAPPAIELDNWLKRGLARLSVEQCATLTLAYQMGFSIEAVAEITRSSLGAVTARLRQAGDELRRSLPQCTSRWQLSASS